MISAFLTREQFREPSQESKCKVNCKPKRAALEHLLDLFQKMLLACESNRLERRSRNASSLRMAIPPVTDFFAIQHRKILQKVNASRFSYLGIPRSRNHPTS